MITFAIIESHPIVRSGFIIHINNNFDKSSIIEFDDLDQYIQYDKIRDSHITIISMYANPIEIQKFTLKKISELSNKSKIILYEESNDFNNLLLYFQSGISGIVSKKSKIDTLTKCINTIKNGKKFICDEVIETILSNNYQSLALKSDSIKLSTREKEISILLIEGKSNSVISQILGIQQSTVSSIKKKVFTKLGVTSIIDLRDYLKIRFPPS